MRLAICSEHAPLADSAYTFKEVAKRASEDPDLPKGWRIVSSDHAGIGKESDICGLGELRLQARSRRQSLQGGSEDVTKDEQPWAAYWDQEPVLGLQHEAKLGLHHNINNLIPVRVRKCNASCQTPPEFFPEVHNAHLCSCDHHSDPAALAASHFARECCPALEDVNQQFQPWLHEAHQMKALHPDPFVLFPQHTFRFWPYPGWFPRDDSPD